MGCTHHTHHAHLQLKSSIKISIEAPKSNFAVCISDAVHLHVHVRRSRLQPGYAHYLLQLADLHTHSTGDVRNGRGAVRCARSPKGGPPSTTARCAGWLTTMSAREVTPLTEVNRRGQSPSFSKQRRCMRRRNTCTTLLCMAN